MWFIIEDDIEGTFMGHIMPGALVSQAEMMRLCTEHEVVKAHCFASQDDALEWVRSQEQTSL